MASVQRKEFPALRRSPGRLLDSPSTARSAWLPWGQGGSSAEWGGSSAPAEQGGSSALLDLVGSWRDFG
jgi:hypothetical protein